MSSKKKSKKGDYEIGFGKPPSWGQFLPGQSGNPRGRPVKQKPISPASDMSGYDAIMRRALYHQVTVQEGGKTRKMSVFEVSVRKLGNNAAKGNVYAERELLKQARDLERRDAERDALAQREAAEMREQNILAYHRMAKVKAERQRIWDEAQARGQEPDNPWPHPDDILLFPAKQYWRPRGPFSEKQVPLFEWRRAKRDYLFAEMVLGSRLNKLCGGKLDMILWVAHDVELPLRWQINHDCMDEHMKLHSIPLKKLRALVEERRKHSEYLKMFSGIPNGTDKETYKIVNKAMKPVLNKCGYRSLAEFERALETQGKSIPRPKAQN